MLAARISRRRTLIPDGIDFCSERGLDLHRLYPLAYRAVAELRPGAWETAADCADGVLRARTRLHVPTILALAALALLRSRRGDPDRHRCSTRLRPSPTRVASSGGIGPVAAGRAETVWLVGRDGEIEAATDSASRSRCVGGTDG